MKFQSKNKVVIEMYSNYQFLKNIKNKIINKVKISSAENKRYLKVLFKYYKLFGYYSEECKFDSFKVFMILNYFENKCSDNYEPSNIFKNEYLANDYIYLLNFIINKYENKKYRLIKNNLKK